MYSLKERLNNRLGLTLIELVVIIAVLGIIASIAVPRYSSFTEHARIAADLATIRNLNSATTLYRMSAPSDPFLDETNNSGELMTVLVDGGYLSSIPAPQQQFVEFNWSYDNKLWMNSVFAVVDNPLTHYNFSTMSKGDFLFNSWGGGGGTTWSVNSNGLSVTGTGNNDLLFLGNKKSEYTLTTTFRLNENPQNNGGVGVFFETVLNGDSDNRDTGYILQFDRGFGEVVLRKRVNGSESSSQGAELLARIGNRSTSTIKNATIPDKSNNTWWESEKELSITVQESGTAGKKLLTVKLNGETLMSNFEIDSDIEAINNHAGLRAWNNQPATIYEMLVND